LGIFIVRGLIAEEVGDIFRDFLVFVTVGGLTGSDKSWYAILAVCAEIYFSPLSEIKLLKGGRWDRLWRRLRLHRGTAQESNYSVEVWVDRLWLRLSLRRGAAKESSENPAFG